MSLPPANFELHRPFRSRVGRDMRQTDGQTDIAHHFVNAPPTEVGAAVNKRSVIQILRILVFAHFKMYTDFKN